jgi:hypothetical protein
MCLLVSSSVRPLLKGERLSLQPINFFSLHLLKRPRRT